MKPKHLSWTAPLSVLGLLIFSSTSVAQDVSTLSEITVTEAQVDGSATKGYRAQEMDFGQLGKMSLKDVPYSINVVSTDLMKNVQASTLAGLVKYVPSAQTADYGYGGGPSGGTGRVQTRGMVSAVFQNTRIDGLTAWLPPQPMEGFERLEVYNGLAGGMYGLGNPAGTFNMVQKRARLNPGAEIGASYRSKAIGQGYADVNSGDLGNGFAMRFTGLYQNGEGWVANSKLKREYAALAMDWYITPRTVIETNFSRTAKFESRFAGNIYYGQTAQGRANTAGGVLTSLPSPIDPTNPAFGQAQYPAHIEADTVVIKLKHEINDNWSFDIAGLYQNSDILAKRYMHTLTDNQGAYRTTMFHAPVVGSHVWSNSAALNGKVKTGGISHDLSFATNGYYIPRKYTVLPPATVVVGNSHLNNPTSYGPFVFPYDGVLRIGQTWRGQNLTFSDLVTFNQNWQVMLKGTQSWFNDRVIDSPFSPPGVVKKNGFSPAASLIFKPTEKISTYLTYASILQQAELAQTSSGILPMDPIRSEQYEVGMKYDGFDVNLNAALFRLERPYAGNDANGDYRIIGEQVNTGLELSASGNLTRRLRIYSGLALIDAKLKNTGIAATSGKNVVGVPKVAANLYFEYDIAQLPGLTLGANIRHTGKIAADNANTLYTRRYSLLDLNVRYVTKIGGHETTFRLNVNNVTNKRYWASVLPANQTGAGGGRFSLTAGMPLDVLASVNVRF